MLLVDAIWVLHSERFSDLVKGKKVCLCLTKHYVMKAYAGVNV
jgi:hypothetical protein